MIEKVSPKLKTRKVIKKSPKPRKEMENPQKQNTNFN